MRLKTIPNKPFVLGAHNEIYRIKLVEKPGERRFGFHNGLLAVGANHQKHPNDRRNESSKYVHVYQASDLGLDSTATWILEFCGDVNNPYDYFIKLYDPHDTSAMGGYLTQSALDGQDKRDNCSAYVHLYYPTNPESVVRWLVIPTEDGNYRIVFKNERGTIRNPDASRKLLLCLHNYFGNVKPSRNPKGRCDKRGDQSAYAHVRIEDANASCSTWSLEVTNWNAILSAYQYQEEEHAEETCSDSITIGTATTSSMSSSTSRSCGHDHKPIFELVSGK